jgi:hypothetical protein
LAAIRWVKVWTASSASASERPLTASVIIDADAWLIEQPRPVKPMARISSCSGSISSDSSTSSPHSGLWPRLATVGCSSRPWLRGFW